MKRVVVTLAAAAAIGSCVAIARYESRITPDFQAQIVELRQSIKTEQNEQTRRLNRLSQEQELENQRLAVENARLYVEIALAEGRSPAKANEKLRAATTLLSTMELASEADGRWD